MGAAFTFGLRGLALLGAVQLPVQEGSTFSMPKNYVIPSVFSGSNIFQFVVVEGLQYPSINLNLQVTKTWFTAAVLNGWFTRTNDDVASAGVFQIWDGVAGVSIPASKVSLLRIGASQGDQMRCVLSLIGYGAPTLLSAKPTGTSAITDNPTMFYNVSAPSGTSSIASWDATLSNNLDMNPELNGTKYPTEFNAGMLTGTLRIVQQAAAVRPADASSLGFTVTPSGDGTPVTITLKNLLCMDPIERSLGARRAMREYNYACLGESASLPPFAIV